MRQFRAKILALVAIAGFWPSAFLAAPLPQAETPEKPQAANTQEQAKAALATADEVLEEMSKTTGLPIKAPLKKALLSRPQIQDYLRQNLHLENTPEEIHAQEATMKAFGLVPADFDLEKFLLQFYTEEVAGFYDPRTKTMNMADWIGPEIQTMVLAHELTHALQDQNFDLDKFLHAARENDDTTAARQAIAEGYAMAAMFQHSIGPVDLGEGPSLAPMMAQLAEQQMSSFPAFSNAPFFFRLQALFPYLQGMTFMQKGLAKGGWKELNTFFENPPTSTKAFFDTDYYFDHKPLPQVTMARPEALAKIPGLHWLYENTMGELGYYGLLAQLTSEDDAKPVAMAWMADHFMVYEYSGEKKGGPKYIVLALSKWESAEKAQGFFQLYRAILDKKYPGIAPDAKSGADLFIGGVGSAKVILSRKNDEVAFAEGIPAEQADSILAYLRSL